MHWLGFRTFASRAVFVLGAVFMALGLALPAGAADFEVTDPTSGQTENVSAGSNLVVVIKAENGWMPGGEWKRGRSEFLGSGGVY